MCTGGSQKCIDGSHGVKYSRGPVRKISQCSEQIYQPLCSTVPYTRAVPKNKCTGNDHELIDEAQAFPYNILHTADMQ